MFIAQCIHDVALSHGLVISLFLAGLVGGATHCVGMCSPFILAQIDSAPNLQKLSASLLLPYHLGRMTTYITLAVLVNAVINLAFIFSDLKLLITVPMLVLAGVVFLISAFPRLSTVFPWATSIQRKMPYRFIAQAATKFTNNPGMLKRYGLGILLGFMPCGLVVSALLASATAPNTLHAALAMGGFTLGTTPALIMVAFGGQALKYKYPKASARLSQGAMVISGLWLFAIAGNLVF